MLGTVLGPEDAELKRVWVLPLIPGSAGEMHVGGSNDDNVVSAELDGRTKALWKHRTRSATIRWKWQKPFPRVGGILTKP